MKLSEFNYEVVLDDNNTGIFNTFKNSLVVFNNLEMEHLHNLDLATKEELDVFANLGLIVDDEADERKEAEEDTIKFSNSDKVTIRLMTTLDCQANCIYCYEHRTSAKMTKDTADKVVEFLRNLSTDKIHIEWFGGEPLYNKDIISYICSKLYEYGIVYTSSMVSNAILADEATVNQFHEWKVNKIQITLDGVGEVYEKIKRVESGTFEMVIDHIKNIINNKIDVNIRLNYFENNYQNLIDLIDYMADNIGYNEYLYYYAYPIFELANEDKEFDAKYVDRIFDLQDHIIERGLMDSKSFYNVKYKPMGCFATHKNGFTIDPDGNLLGCSHVTNILVGDVVNGPNENHVQFLADVPERCKTCILYPVCKGGCKVAQLGYDKVNQCYMYKNRFDQFVKRMISNKLSDSVKQKEEVLI